MLWCDEALARFCQGLGVELPETERSLITLELDQLGILQIERHDASITLWWVLEVSSHEAPAIIERALRLTYSSRAPALPLRCGWVGRCELLLFITLATTQVTLPLLQQAYETLLAARYKVLDR
ncbi:type III secretion chaperone SycN [Pseudomonas fontis]|uniref:Type III secretion chaperone SycN n=1 Tax=Pseudomonas fontis TaxID=2942633 RepID=A0ABT5NZT7_9PSED|nr:type III secretion chaperone SycN [Pseudomonas fontis]MDD0976396.1 type III secretion chaperone SycN [Pseudomonas fontis]MDD0993718.1 type III secretion chaperone SycN [Pseudomonas fontis]